jgi:hypothetical protein
MGSSPFMATILNIKSEYEQVIRVALTGTVIGPNIYKIMEIMGRDKVIERLENFMIQQLIKEDTVEGFCKRLRIPGCP